MFNKATIIDLIEKYAQLQYKEDEVIRIIKEETGEVIYLYTDKDYRKAYEKGKEQFDLLERVALRKKAAKGDQGAIARLKELGMDEMDRIFYKNKPK